MSSEAAGSVILSLVQDMVNEPFEEAIRFVRLDNSKGAVARLKDMVYSKEVSDGTGRNRENRRKAIMLLQEAGWTLQDGQMKNAAGEPLSFEILVSSPDDERLALNYAQSLKGIGVAANVRNVDSTQYEQRRHLSNHLCQPR